MKIIQLQLCVLFCCQAAVSDLLTDLGSNVTINCDLDENEVYWILLKTADPPTVILRSFSTSSPHHFNKSFRKKYSVQFKHRLVINNITADELGVYYCMNTETLPKLSNSTRIYFNESLLSECHNHTVTEIINQNQPQCQIIIIISALMNGFLLILLIGLVMVFVVGKRRSVKRSQQHNTDLQQMQALEQQQNPNQLQYAEVDFTKQRRKIRTSPVDSTYATLKPPKS
ncbi:uncharacterized protein LOC122327155 [Puntigrus tetrazona]|uniref:uncharacterized protein LOC122327155 n=1 Tax=Puntigrus tetrazona TaxID=1606681 RepID=UPI001C8AF5CC|nr:uncharacterized protein LOC122327155 [Puntigrus tetrazona]